MSATEHGPYLNAAVSGRTTLSPRNLMDRLLDIEEERGRTRPYPMAPRTLDLDLILYGSAIINEDGLRFRTRTFASASSSLRPARGNRAGHGRPGHGKSVAELLTNEEIRESSKL